jgi:hypothetical protein
VTDTGIGIPAEQEINDPTMVEFGIFDPYRNLVKVNMLHHSSAQGTASTVVHEATHQNGYFKGIPQNTQFDSISSIPQ